MPTHETRQRIDRLRQSMDEALAGGETSGQRLQAVAEVLTNAFGGSRSLLGRVRGDSAAVVAGVGLGLAGIPVFAALPPGRGIVWRAVRTAATQRVDDVLRDPDYFSVSATTRSELVTPVLRNGRPVLTLNLESNRVGAFTAEDAEVLEAAARWLARRIDRLGLGA